MTPNPKKYHSKKEVYKCASNQCFRNVASTNSLCPSCQIKVLTPKRQTKLKQIKLFDTQLTEKQKTFKKNKAYFHKALKSFQRLRRIQEADENGFVRCVNGEIRKWNKCDGGHYFSSGKCRSTAFTPMNVNPQSKDKNLGMGTGFIMEEYRAYLIAKYGKESFEKLEIQARVPKRWNDLELIEIRKIFDLEFEKVKKVKNL